MHTWLTLRVAKLPSTDVRLDNHAQLYAAPLTVAFCLKISPPSVAVNAQIKIAMNVIGVTIDLNINNHLNLFGLMIKNGICNSQNKKNATIVFVVMPCDSGI